MTKTDRAVERFAAMMIETIEGLEQGWRKTWLTSSASGRPMNASGREYSRMNEFFLTLHCIGKGYELPVFVTFNQCRDMGAQVKKGEKSFPVLFWNSYAKNKKTGENITMQEYNQLDKASVGEWRTAHTLRSYDVFNVEQTTLAEVKPEMIAALACALHEMAHSTGKHLNREDKARRFGDKEYGREELVAELTAAMCGNELGFTTAVRENNAAYLSTWLKAIKQEPSFLVSVLADVSKATSFIDERLQATA